MGPILPASASEHGIPTIPHHSHVRHHVRARGDFKSPGRCVILCKWHTTLFEGHGYLWIQILEMAQGPWTIPSGTEEKLQTECIVSEWVSLPGRWGHSLNPSTREAEASRSRSWQSCLPSEIVSIYWSINDSFYPLSRSYRPRELNSV